eukprot:COSAG02_NODE_40854_length_400_cov_5.877076_1_plen_65_part_10
MSLLPPSETGAPPSTAQSVKSARSDLVGTIHVPRKLRDLTSNLPNPRCAFAHILCSVSPLSDSCP